MPLGIDSANEYPPRPAAQLAADDLLFLYTDGIVEAGSEGSVGQFGIERTLDLLRAYRKETPDQVLDAIYGDARGFSAGCDQADDMTAILVKVDADNQTRVVPSAGSM
jgi:serine phosphatase RsbU (regulator of sigma subunit)